MTSDYPNPYVLNYVTDRIKAFEMLFVVLIIFVSDEFQNNKR
jgi:hypothetical protein